MTPPEKMAVQGIFVPTYISAQFDMELLDDLTGNSFSSFCFAGVQLAFTVVQGRRHKRLLQESQAASAKDMDNLLAEGLDGGAFAEMICEDVLAAGISFDGH